MEPATPTDGQQAPRNDTSLPPGRKLNNNYSLTDKFKELLTTRNSEQAELQELNERFASYIEKIRSLEQQNQTLEDELKKLRGHESKRSTDLYKKEINNLREQLLTHNQNSSRLELQVEDLTNRLQKAIDEKEEAEKKLASLKEDMDAPTLARKVLEREIENLKEQIAFKEKIHEEEIQEMQYQLQETKIPVQTDGAKSDLTAALRDLRAQFKDMAQANTAETEEWYKSKMSDLNETANKNNDALKMLRQENTELRHQIQKNTREISSLKTVKEDLDNQMKEMEEYHKGEIAKLQKTNTSLEDENNKIKDDMEFQLREYEDLLKVKVALDVEIATYRKLLEGVESRLEPSRPNNSDE